MTPPKRASLEPCGTLRPSPTYPGFCFCGHPVEAHTAVVTRPEPCDVVAHAQLEADEASARGEAACLRNTLAIIGVERQAALADLVATRAELTEALATLAAERGDAAGALEGWAYHVDSACHDYWTRDDARAPFGVCVVRRCLPHGWTGDGVRGSVPTAREAMRAAEAALTGATP